MKNSAIPPALPPGADFAFGKSPFRVKGVLYLGTQAFFDENVRGGLATLAAEIEEPELRAFITQKFLPSGLYDVTPVAALIACEARTLRMSLEEYLLHRTRYQAKKDLGGVYAWMLRLASPRLVARQSPKLIAQMFDFAQARVVEDDDVQTVVAMAGVPAVLAPWLDVSLRVYCEAAVKLAGGNVTGGRPSLVEGGTRAGLRTVELQVPLVWDR